MANKHFWDIANDKLGRAYVEKARRLDRKCCDLNIRHDPDLLTADSQNLVWGPRFTDDEKDVLAELTEDNLKRLLTQKEYQWYDLVLRKGFIKKRAMEIMNVKRRRFDFLSVCAIKKMQEFVGQNIP